MIKTKLLGEQKKMLKFNTRKQDWEYVLIDAPEGEIVIKSNTKKTRKSKKNIK